MKMKLYSLCDSVIGDFTTQPISAPNDEAIIRSIKEQIINTKEIPLKTLDEELYRIGEYDTDTGIIEPEKPTKIITIKAIKQALEME